MTKTRKKKTLFMLGAFTLIVCSAVMASQARNIELFLERGDIEESLRNYFAAEMNRDLKEVYTCLAPSSVYRTSHTYEEFLKDVEDTPVRIARYQIIDIYNLRKNTDRAAYPDVERLVQAEVDVVLTYTDTDDTHTLNYCFTFLKEKGIWYKG